jgi:hypothetical protein
MKIIITLGVLLTLSVYWSASSIYSWEETWKMAQGFSHEADKF